MDGDIAAVFVVMVVLAIEDAAEIGIASAETVGVVAGDTVAV